MSQINATDLATIQAFTERLSELLDFDSPNAYTVRLGTLLLALANSVETLDTATSAAMSAPVDDIAALQTVLEADRTDKQLRAVEDDGFGQRAIYMFDDASAATADGLEIIAPSVGSGRWFRVADGAGADCGDGSDGALVFDGVADPVAGASLVGNNYTLTRDIHATSIQVDAGIILSTEGFRIFATIKIVNAGAIGVLGGSGSGDTAGGGSPAGSLAGGANGGAGKTGGAGAGAPGTGVTNAPGGAGGAGGDDDGVPTNAGGAAGAAADPAANEGSFRSRPQTVIGSTLGGSGITRLSGGGGGGGGGADGSGTGGGGGGGSGVVMLTSPKIHNTATGWIVADGGVGADGSVLNAGGGAGGGGGLVLLNYRSLVNEGNITVAGGAGGAGAGTGTDGVAGVAGRVIQVRM